MNSACKQTESELDIAHREAMEDIQAGGFTIIKDVDGHITSLEKGLGLLDKKTLFCL